MDTEPTLIVSRSLSGQTNHGKTSRLPRIFGYDFFVSFKLGAPPMGAQSYASDLARCLRELDYTVFYSEEEAVPGAELDSTLIKALHGSRILIVVVTLGALKSHWVRKEVEEFRTRWPSRPVIIINVDHVIETQDKATQEVCWLGYEGRIWLDETAAATQEGIVSKDIVDRIRLAPQFLRANLLLRSSVTTIILVLVTLTIFSWHKNTESHERLVAYNLSQGRASLTAGRALEAAPSLLRAFQDGEQSSEVRFMLARAFASIDQLLARFDSSVLAFSPDGRSVAIARNDGSIEIRDSKDLSIKTMLTRHKTIPVSALMFSSDSQTLIVEAAVANTDNSDVQPTKCVAGIPSGAEVTLWDATNGRLLQTFTPHDSGHDCQHTFFMEQDRVVTTATWTTQYSDLYWSAASFDRNAEPLGTTIVSDNRKCQWSQNTTAPPLQEGSDLGCPGQVVGVATDGAFVAVAPWDIPKRDIDIWSLSNGNKQTLSFGRDTHIQSATFSPDNKHIVVTLDDGIEVWRLPDSSRIARVNMDTAGVPVSFSPDGARLIAIRGERDAQIVDTTSLESLAILIGHTTKIRTAVFSADGTRVLTGGDDGVAKLWDGWTGRLITTLEGHQGPVVEVGFSPDDHLIFTRDANGDVYLWDNRSLTISQTLGDDPQNIRWWDLSSPTFEVFERSPDGRDIVLSHRDWGGTLYTLWDATRGLLRGQWRAEVPSVRWPITVNNLAPDSNPQCDIDNNAQKLASDGFGNSVVLDSTPGGQNVVVWRGSKLCTSIRLEGHRAKITAAAIDTSTDRLVTADERGEIRVWNMKNGRLMSQLQSESPVSMLTFLSKDRILALNERRNTAVLFDVSLEQRPFAELQHKLYCSKLIAEDTIIDLVPAGSNCNISVPSRIEWAGAAANALLINAWEHRHQSNAISLMRDAANLYQQANDIFGLARVTIALRALALDGGDINQATELELRARELISQLAQADDQYFRLLRLGDIAFNQFNDVELAKLCWTLLLSRSPEEQAAQIALSQTSVFDNPDLNLVSGGSSSMRQAVLAWISAVVTGKDTDSHAYNLWNLYEGTTIDPIYESMDFRGLQRQLKSSSLPIASKRVIADVLYELAKPGNHSHQIKNFLRVPDDAQTIGP